ncbi:DUF3098 domain-containing protein [Dysgonomonas sp. Marseille-P4361]|uniref:DUF3098 domain-containing protein n=1 Tax=Dysgonomonas sp. Marseille-P4361 TaxID=2161820 RepID=UPI000D55F800|nr:DUF3098 domain-containing protein [Dysgonomonas sp. Marseille-P4361]
MDKINFAFGKMNYLICGVSVLLIILGFVLMTGPASTIEGGFEPDVFSTKRIVIAPMVCFFGFLLMIVGILFPRKRTEANEQN